MPEHANAIKASKSPPILILGHPGKSVTFLSKLDNTYRRQPVVSRHSTKLQYHLSPVLPVLPLSNLFNISILIFSAFPKVSSYLLLLSYIPPPSPAITFHSTDSSIHKMVDNVDGEETTTHENEWEVPKTSDNEEGGEAVPRGNEWEVVSLTASAYAASPGPRGDVTIHEEKALMLGEDYEAESSRALFMSGHFVFPPSQHENLPIEPESLVISKGLEEDESAGERNVANDSKDEQKEVENWNIEGLNMPEEFPGISFFEEKANKMLSFHGPGFDKSATLHQLDVDDKEPKVYGTAKFSPFLSETEIGGPAAFVESVLSDYDESSDHGLDPSSLISKPTKFGDEDEFDDSELPCGAWWKRRVVSLCAHVKDTNAFWSIFVAAAVMGLVILGQRWQQERWVVLQQRWQLSVGNEKSGRILSRLKDVIVGGSRRNTYITAASADR